MKKCALILLLVLFSALCSPLTIIAAPSDSGSFLITLDVCSSSGSFMSVNADGAAIQESSLSMVPLVFSGYIEEANSVFNPSVIISKQERPPQA
ncbi:MAG: hypothetical protein HZA15_09865 [Nitrospirae bacterium]|nr:hypothetical protein [Nitrospirota bacterium]